MRYIRSAISAFLLISLGVVISLVLLEAFVRYVPSSITHYRRDPLFVPDDKIGLRHKPDSHEVNVDECNSMDDYINLLGFHDRNWPVDATGGIAVLGNSYMEAAEVHDDQTPAAELSQRLQVPVYNFGMSGMGPVLEREVYQAYIRPLHPKVVVLYFLTKGDVTVNSCFFSRQSDGSVPRPCMDTPDQEVPTKGFYVRAGPVYSWMRTSCESCRYLKQIADTFKDRVAQTSATSVDSSFTTLASGELPFQVRDYAVYFKQPDPEVEKAWAITETALLRLKHDVEQDGSTLVVVSVPDILRVTLDWKKDVSDSGGGNYVSSLDPWAPLQRLADMTKRDGIRFFEMEDGFRAYRDQYHLQYPYFSFACNAHFSPLGSELVAYLTAQYLHAQKLYPFSASSTSSTAPDLSAVGAPEQVLGQEMLQRIYKTTAYGSDQ